MDSVTPSPILADAKRQAVHSIRGYEYQIALTALEWLDLSSEEAIVVEGAEDFDRLGQTDVMNQAKDLSANLTLRSADVLEAIENFWETANNNPGRSLQYRFLTTAVIGREQGTSLPEAGLSFWNRLRRLGPSPERDVGCRAVADFLADSDKISEGLRDFLREANGDDVHTRLIGRMEFVTQGPELPELGGLIRDRLVFLGEKFGVSAPNAERAIDRILGVVKHAACNPALEKRFLDRSRLLREFAGATETSVPSGIVEKFDAVSALVSDLQARLAPGGLDFAATVVSALSEPPPLPANYFFREDALSRIDSACASTGVSVIIGSRKIGKSLSAVAAVHRIGGTWLWVDLSSKRSAPEQLRLAAAEISKHSGYRGVVIDGLPTHEGNGNVVGSLARIHRSVAASNASLIVTTERELPAPTMLSVSLTPQSFVELLPFTEPEVQNFLTQSGSSHEAAAAWDSILLARTLGEPLLVSVYVGELRREGFRMPNADDLLQPKYDVASAERDMRLLARHGLDEQSYELLIRLSLANFDLTREMIVAIAEAPPPVGRSASTLDSLVGPWVQRTSPDRYRVSSIAASFAVDEQPLSWHADMRRVIGRALLSPRTITTDDAANSLLMGVLAHDADLIGDVLGHFLILEDSEVWRAFARSAAFLPKLWLHELSIPEYLDSRLAALVRLAQIRVSVTNGSTIDGALLEKFDAELPVTGNEDRRRTRFLGLTLLLTKAPRSLQSERLVRYVREWGELFENVAGRDAVSVMQRSLSRPGEDTSPMAAMAFTALGRALAAAQFESLALAVEREGGSFPGEFFAVLEDDSSLAVGFASSLYRRELAADGGSLQELADSMSSSCRILQRSGIVVTADAVGGAAVMISCDFGDGPERAVEIYDRIVNDAGTSMPRVEIARAHIFAKGKQYDEALEVLERLLPTTCWDGQDLILYDAFREGARCASELGNWKRAAVFLQMVSDLIDREMHPLWSVAIDADLAYAYWMAGQSDLMMPSLLSCAALLGSIVVEPGNPRQLMVLKRVGHSYLCMLHSRAVKQMGSFVASAAMSSNLDTDVPNGLALPNPTPVDDIVASIAFLLAANGAPVDSVAPMLVRLSESSSQIAHSIVDRLRQWQTVKQGLVEEFVPLSQSYADDSDG